MNKKLLTLIFGIIAVAFIVLILHSAGSDSAKASEDDFNVFLQSGPAADATYVGSQTCNDCGHQQVYENWNTTTHARMLVNGTVAEAAGLPKPDGLSWDNITYVIGHKWKIRYVNESGYIITYNGSGNGNNQWDVADKEWDDYHPGELKPYNCGQCHTTGYDSNGHQDSLPGIIGTWNETGIGCEACHGPGSEHIVAQTKSTIKLDRSSESCGSCHQRPYNGKITEVNPDRKHHEQYNDWYNSEHQENDVECINCHNPHRTSDEIYSNYSLYTSVRPAKVMYYEGPDYDRITEDYIQVSGPQELCLMCHDIMKPNGIHGNNTVQAHCVDCHMPLSRKTVNSWDIRSHTFKVDDGMEYDPAADSHTSNFPYFTCEQSPCHIEGIPYINEWEGSNHAQSNHGFNSNDFCAVCHSPFQGDPLVTNKSNSKPVSIRNWTGVNCNACHDLHNDPSSMSVFNGSSGIREEPVTNPSDLCGVCHNSIHSSLYSEWKGSSHAKSNHGTNNNTYCAHCMSPFEADPLATYTENKPISAEDWNGITCIVCHEQHSLELALFNGSGREPPVTNPADLCGGCHGGSRHPQYDEWSTSVHANSLRLDHGNDNTFCARCHAPFQSDPHSTATDNEKINITKWTAITCTVCHNPHSLELTYWNGEKYEDINEDPNELCSKCHGGTQDFEGAPFVIDIESQWKSSAHANTYHGYNGNTYCAHCMSPYEADPEATHSDNEEILEKDWSSVGCVVCHNPHNLELAIYKNGIHESVEDSNELCGSCHTMDDAEPGDTPRHSQIEMRTGTGGYGVDSVTFMASLDCSDCHAYESDHTFEPKAEACIECHKGYTKETAQNQIDVWQGETQELLEKVGSNLTHASKIKESGIENLTWTRYLNDTYNQALFNYEFVLADGSTGVHNPDYSKALLYDANRQLNRIFDIAGIQPLINITPAHGSTNILVDTTITVQFIKDIDFTKFEFNNYLTLDKGVTGTLTYNSTTYTIVFTPSTNLSFDTTYTVTLSKNTQYLVKNIIPMEVISWSFITEKGDGGITPQEPVVITFTIGPINDENNKPLEGVLVTITISGEKFIGITQTNGMATIDVEYEMFKPGNYVITASKDGYEPLEFEGTLGEDGTFNPPENGIPEMKEETDDERSIFMYAFSTIIILILAVIIIVLLKLSKKPEKKKVIEKKVRKPSRIMKPGCPKCGAAISPADSKCSKCGTEFDA